MKEFKLRFSTEVPKASSETVCKLSHSRGTKSRSGQPQAWQHRQQANDTFRLSFMIVESAVDRSEA
jgi:hypothetical protein